MLMQNTVSILTFKMWFKPYWFHTCFRHGRDICFFQNKCCEKGCN